MFKIVLNDGKNLPDEKILYVVSKNGIFLKKKVGIVESLTKIGGVSFLEEIKPYARLHIPKIPAQTFAKIITFFRKIYEVHSTECNAIIYYNEKTKKFRAIIPPQKTSGASVSYIRIPSMKGYVRLSTIHSHPNFSASHSSVDVGDEKDSDGLHITVGNITRPMFEIVASVVVGGTRFKVNPEDYISGIRKEKVEVQKAEVVSYKSPYLSYLLGEESNIPLFTQTDYSEGYKFTKWRKKFERYNPDWFKSVKPVQLEYEISRWDESGSFETGYRTTVNDLFPKETKTERKEEKEFNPCEKCAFKTFKPKKELMGESHGTQHL